MRNRPTGCTQRTRLWGVVLLLGTACGSGGCTVDAWYHGDAPWPFWMPVPVPQWIGDRIQERKEKDYSEVPLMPPVRDYAKPFCADPPSEYDILRAMPRPEGTIPNVPFLHERHYDDMEFVVEKLVDELDECRFYPLVGPAQLHHCHYKCYIYFTNLRLSHYPFAWWVEKEDVEVVYIDKDHLHICTTPEMEAIPESYEDIYGPY